MEEGGAEWSLVTGWMLWTRPVRKPDEEVSRAVEKGNWRMEREARGGWAIS